MDRCNHSRSSLSNCTPWIVKVWTGNYTTRAEGRSRRLWMPLPPTAYALLPVQTMCDMCSMWADYVKRLSWCLFVAVSMKCYVVSCSPRIAQWKWEFRLCAVSCYNEIGKTCTNPLLEQQAYQVALKKERDVEWDHVAKSVVHRYPAVALY